MEITLSPDLTGFLNSKIVEGAYSSPDDVVSDALRLMRDQDDRIDALRRDIQAGIDEGDRGETAPLDIEAIKAEARSVLTCICSGRELQFIA